MKRYRVWQANREVFLWPENWLYPELRDNQSPIFQQMMSSLLQGDITDDAAASAYLDYLSGLEEVAKLEPCGMYYQPGAADTDETCYVVARTAGANRKYYFRELTSGSWTPWSQVMIDCEDMPVTPVVWNGRLFLFWLKVVKQAQPAQAQVTSTSGDGTLADMPVSDLASFTAAAASNASQKSVTVQAVLCWAEFYNGKWQPTKTSDVNHPTTLGQFDTAGPGAFENYRTLIQIAPAELMSPQLMSMLYNTQFTLPDGALILDISVPGQSPDGGFVLYNTHSLPVRFEDIEVIGFRRGTFGGHPIEWPIFLPMSVAARPAGPGPVLPPGAAVYRGIRQRHVRDQLPARPGPPGDVCEQHPAVHLAAPVRPAAALAARRVGRPVPLRGPAAPVLRDHHGAPGPDPVVHRLRGPVGQSRRARLRAGDLPGRAGPAGHRGHAAGSPGRHRRGRRPGGRPALHLGGHEHQGRPGPAAGDHLPGPADLAHREPAVRPRRDQRTRRLTAMREVDGLGAFHNAGDIGLVYQLGTSQDGDGAILRLPYQEKFSYTFGNFFHPFVGDLIKQLNQTSVAGMLDPVFLESLHYAYTSADYTRAGRRDRVGRAGGPGHRRLDRRPVRELQLGAAVPHPGHDRGPPERQSALRRSAEMVPSRLRPDQHRHDRAAPGALLEVLRVPHRPGHR